MLLIQLYAINTILIYAIEKRLKMLGLFEEHNCL